MELPMTATKTTRKQPQDRKPKQETPKVTETTFELTGREVQGWEVSMQGMTVRVPREALDDFELLDELGQMQSGEATSLPSLPKLLRRLVGPDYKPVMEGLRDPQTGRVSVQAGTQFVMDLFKALNPNG